MHFRSTCPKIVDCCYFGIDIPERSDLVANKYSDEAAICQQLHATTLKYQTLEGLKRAVGDTAEDYCYACLGGDYPMEIPGVLRNNGKYL